ncbi:MAG: hypothetical protein FWE80_00310 [Oscillospiraceae bacterium]|nr:hypothetical protein [Oscillospiraceae bacterium]
MKHLNKVYMAFQLTGSFFYLITTALMGYILFSIIVSAAAGTAADRTQDLWEHLQTAGVLVWMAMVPFLMLLLFAFSLFAAGQKRVRLSWNIGIILWSVANYIFFRMLDPLIYKAEWDRFLQYRWVLFGWVPDNTITVWPLIGAILIGLGAVMRIVLLYVNKYKNSNIRRTL